MKITGHYKKEGLQKYLVEEIKDIVKKRYISEIILSLMVISIVAVFSVLFKFSLIIIGILMILSIIGLIFGFNWEAKQSRIRYKLYSNMLEELSASKEFTFEINDEGFRIPYLVSDHYYPDPKRIGEIVEISFRRIKKAVLWISDTNKDIVVFWHLDYNLSHFFSQAQIQEEVEDILDVISDKDISIKVFWSHWDVEFINEKNARHDIKQTYAYNEEDYSKGNRYELGDPNV